MNVYILRWNPAISSYKMEEHLDLVSHVKKWQFPMHFNWSVREWQKLKKNDAFILLQVGTDNDGIALVGKFCSEPYESASWRNDGTKIHYANMQIFDAFDLANEPKLRAENFESSFPKIRWHGGHSGELINEESASALLEKLKIIMKDSERWREDSFEDFMESEIEILMSSPSDTDIEWLSKKRDEILSELAEYNPIIHTCKDEGFEEFEEGDISVEIINPSTQDSLFIDFEFYQLSIYFDSWHTHYSLTDEDFSEMKTQLQKILHNESCALIAKSNDEWLGDKISDKGWKKGTDFETLIKEFNFLGKDKKSVTEISVAYWDNEKSFVVNK